MDHFLSVPATEIRQWSDEFDTNTPIRTSQGDSLAKF